MFQGVRDTSDNSVTGGGGNPEGKKVSVPIRDTSDYSVTGGGGRRGVRNDNGGIFTAEMEKKCFSFCHHAIPISLLTKMHRVNFYVLISKLSFFFSNDILFKVPLIPPTYHHIFLCVPFPRIWFLLQRHACFQLSTFHSSLYLFSLPCFEIK